MEYYATQKFHEARMAKIEAAVKTSYIIESKAINNHFLHTDILMEYFDHCVKPKLLYACQVWAVGCSKDGWIQLERVQLEFYKRHFSLPAQTNGITLLTEIGAAPIQVEALILTIQMVQGLKEIPQDRVPNLALQASKHMKSGWWTQFMKWLDEWGLKEARIYKYEPSEIRKIAQKAIWTTRKRT